MIYHNPNRHVAFALCTGMVLLAVIGGCASGGSTSPSAGPSAAMTSTATRTTVSSPTPLPGLPAEVIGSWETDLRDFRDEVCLECGPVVSLTIYAYGSWAIQRAGGGASGRISISDGHIIFEGSVQCGEAGAYQWEADGDTLTLTSEAPDPCGRRAEALDGPTYKRTE